MEWLITTDHLTPARDCPVVVGEDAFDVAYSKVDGCCHYCTRKDE
jgi:hypothetical protein